MAYLAIGLQEAVFRTLSKGRALPLVGVVQEAVPVAYPYITFGQTGVYDSGTGKDSDSEQLFTLHIWSKARSDDEALAIMRRAKALLDGRGLTLEDGSFVMVRLEFAEARNDEDLELRHGLLRFHATERTRRPRTVTKA